MPANLQTRLSPRLALYGITFRVLRSLALQANGRAPRAEPALPRPRRRPASLELETAQSGPLHPPVAEQ